MRMIKNGDCQTTLEEMKWQASSGQSGETVECQEDFDMRNHSFFKLNDRLFPLFFFFCVWRSLVILRWIPLAWTRSSIFFKSWRQLHGFPLRQQRECCGLGSDQEHVQGSVIQSRAAQVLSTTYVFITSPWQGWPSYPQSLQGRLYPST